MRVIVSVMKTFGIVVAALVGGAGVAQAQPKKIDLNAELQTIAAAYEAKPNVPKRTGNKACTQPTKEERADVQKRALAWIDARHPEEKGEKVFGKDQIELVVNIGCKEPSGAIVLDVSQDRELKKAKQDALGRSRRNYLLRVTATTVEVLAEDVSDHTQNWMEWADQGRIALIAQVDVDGDGAVDIVYADHEREGGAINSDDQLHVQFADGRVAHGGVVTNLTDVVVVGSQLVVSAETRQGHAIYVCLARDLQLAPCAAAKPWQAAADRRWIVEQITQSASGPLPDRELVKDWLIALGTPAKKRAQLMAAAPETTPVDRVQRKVTAFLVKAGHIEPAPMPELIRQTHPAARAYLDGLAAKLGDSPCAKMPLTADEEKRANAWVKKQDAKAHTVMMVPAGCGPYTWVAWDNDSGAGRRQVLLGRDGTTRLLGFTYDPVMPGDSGFDHVDRWFTHDGTIVGVAYSGTSLWVIANGKVVATTKGAVGLYRADDRWDETSSSVFVDNGTLWHATPTGREKLDRALVKDHEERRAAIALLSQAVPSSDPKYIAALRVLGADKALIAEAKKLP